jgi:hypothetical protein
MIAATLAAVTFAVSPLSTILAHAQSADAAAVEQAGETLRKLMINPDQPALEQIFADQLSYGHSDGRVQTKAEFVDALVNGKSVFKSISLTGQTISIVGDIAIVRHRFEADTVQWHASAAAHRDFAGVAEAGWRLAPARPTGSLSGCRKARSAAVALETVKPATITLRIWWLPVAAVVFRPAASSTRPAAFSRTWQADGRTRSRSRAKARRAMGGYHKLFP